MSQSRTDTPRRKELEAKVVSAVLDLFLYTNAHAFFDLPIPLATPPLLISCGEREQLAHHYVPSSETARVSEIPATADVIQLLRDIQSNMAVGEPEWSSIEGKIESVLRAALKNAAPQAPPNLPSGLTADASGGVSVGALSAGAAPSDKSMPTPKDIKSIDDFPPQVRACLKEMGFSEVDQLGGIEAPLALLAASLEHAHRSARQPTTHNQHVLQTEEKDTKLLAAWTPTNYGGRMPPYINLTMVRMKGDVILTVRLPSYYHAPDGQTSAIRFPRDLWLEFKKQMAEADKMFEACDFLDGIP